jgi:hypothetical protein
MPPLEDTRFHSSFREKCSGHCSGRILNIQVSCMQSVAWKVSWTFLSSLQRSGGSEGRLWVQTSDGADVGVNVHVNECAVVFSSLQ